MAPTLDVLVLFISNDVAIEKSAVITDCDFQKQFLIQKAVVLPLLRTVF